MKEFRTHESNWEHRVARLERANRVAAVTMVAMLGGLLFVAASADTKPTERILSAAGFELLDGEGRVVAILGFDGNGAGLFVRDSEGADRISLVHQSDQTGLFLSDASGHVRVGAAQFAHGGGGFALHGEESKGAAVLYLKGEGSLRFIDPEGTVTYQAPGPDDG